MKDERMKEYTLVWVVEIPITLKAENDGRAEGAARNGIEMEYSINNGEKIKIRPHRHSRISITDVK